MAMIIKYTRQQYERKITALEGYAAQLKTHLAELEGYKNKIKQIWNDEQGVEYYKQVSKYVRACKNALDRVDRVRMIYQEAMGDMVGTGTVIDETIADAKSVASGLNIEGDE